MKHYSNKYLKKNYTPKVLRKTARMIRTNAGYTEQWINKLLGHSPGTKVTGHYVNHAGVKNEPIANEKLKAQQYPSIKKEYEKIKLKMQAQEQQMTTMEDKLMTKMAENEEMIKNLAIDDIKKNIKKKKSI